MDPQAKRNPQDQGKPAPNPLASLHDYGQAPWLDFLARGFIAEGGLKRLVEHDGLTGVTSNPSIFEKAIGGSSEYDSALKAILGEGDVDVMQLYERLAIEDIQHAADVLRPVYESSKGADGYVSLEVSPYLAMSTQATVAEARRLWRALARPNVMIKVPATRPGLPAIRQLIADGINVNITLLFSQQVYAEVVEAYLAGLEQLVAQGGDPGRVASVASFFVSRIDVAVDKLIDEHLRQGAAADRREALAAIAGKVAIANAKLAYQRYKRLFAGARWEKLRAKGARVQRLLWASTGTKNKSYGDVLYVEELIAADTVNTMPPATMDAFRDHGKPRASLEENIAQAEQVMATLERAGISIDTVTARLVEEGVQLFADAFDKLLGAVAGKRTAILGDKLDSQIATLPGEFEKTVAAALESWRHDGNVRRLWAGDASLWTGADEAQWLGWLGIVEQQRKRTESLANLAAEIRGQHFAHILLLGMGGSSLGPEVLAETFGPQSAVPSSWFSTRPIRRRSGPSKASAILPARCSSCRANRAARSSPISSSSTSSSGRKRRSVPNGPGRASSPSPIRARSCRRRPSASAFDTSPLGCRASADAIRCSRTSAWCRPPPWGSISAGSSPRRRPWCTPAGPMCRRPKTRASCSGPSWASRGKSGRDKVTIVASPGIADFGAWLEQLLAESTGKQGRGLIPVGAEPLGDASQYGQDRLFVYLRLTPEADPKQDQAVAAVEQAGHPVVRIAVTERYHIGQEFFRWEIATAVAGAILRINPFDQPDVEASKVKTRELTSAYEASGALPAEAPFFAQDGIALFANEKNREALGVAGSLAGYLAAHLRRLKAGDYCALLAYVERNGRHRDALQDIRRTIRDSKRVATCLGFGPRFLHSTGQAYKGGPNTGVFLQITCDDANDLQVPGQKYTFGIVKAAQARGDFEVLAERGRRALRIHLGPHVAAGLTAIKEALRQALG